MERALRTEVGEVHVSYPVTDGFAQANQNTTAEAAAAAVPALVEAAHAARRRVTVTLSCAFGCPFDGLVDPGLVADHVARAAAAGADEVLLADTIGVGNPRQTTRLVVAAVAGAGAGRIGVHLHNTRNAGYANAVAALEAGATLLDASLGGLGGCPFAPNATGNIATEDLVGLLEGMGISTGIDLDRLLGAVAELEQSLGHALPGLLHRAPRFPAR
jgi:hydroxymethylglutaryl-CoA lyase/(R)-citramalyl-CoA lyase